MKIFLNEEGLLNALLANDQLVLVFKIIEQLALSDCWLCAGQFATLFGIIYLGGQGWII